MNDIFTIVGETDELVALKVRELSNLDIAMNPYLSGDYDYITLTKGRNHTLTVVKKDGKTFSFFWGERGTERISDGLETLKRKVLNFLADNFVFIDVVDELAMCHEFRVYYNDNFNQWQFSFKDTHNNNEWFRHYNIHSFGEMMNYVKTAFERKGINNFDVNKGIAQTGIDVWYISI